MTPSPQRVLATPYKHSSWMMLKSLGKLNEYTVSVLYPQGQRETQTATASIRI
jgi:hypothetical protein